MYQDISIFKLLASQTLQPLPGIFQKYLDPTNDKSKIQKSPVKRGKKSLKIEATKSQNPMLLVRIDSPEWMNKLRFEDYDAVILSYKRSDWDQFNVQAAIHQQNKQKIRIELPKFISENQLDYYRNLAARLFAAGYTHFFISHLSQKTLLPAGSKFSCNENVYVLNDAAARILQDEKAAEFMYPFENDLDNLLSMSNKQGIVPIYFYPQLFYSRMPVKVNAENKLFADENNKKYRKTVKDGITIVYPVIPVALLHYRNQLEKNGFNRFLIDYTGELMTANIVKRILKKYIIAESVQPSTSFNFKLGLS